MPTQASFYRGRFAPSPTGPLHLGSLYTALASFLQARSHNGHWLLRIDDLDTPRNQRGAVAHILHTLDACGLHWHGAALYQSQQRDVYDHYLNELSAKHLLYACECSRKNLTGIYPKTCRYKTINRANPHALRVKTDNRFIQFNDYLQGAHCQQLEKDHGDFILKRKDGIIAYQFAVVIDDYLQQITHIVRGMDLLDATPKQIYVQQLLGFTAPNYSHVPIIIDAQGQKLSKQSHAQAVNVTNPAQLLCSLLVLLKQNPPAELIDASRDEVLQWAICHWQINALKNQQTLPLENPHKLIAPPS